jgi:hypothetical protein
MKFHYGIVSEGRIYTSLRRLHDVLSLSAFHPGLVIQSAEEKQGVTSAEWPTILHMATDQFSAAWVTARCCLVGPDSFMLVCDGQWPIDNEPLPVRPKHVLLVKDRDFVRSYQVFVAWWEDADDEQDMPPERLIALFYEHGPGLRQEWEAADARERARL